LEAAGIDVWLVARAEAAAGQRAGEQTCFDSILDKIKKLKSEMKKW
jgi:hypothetical protein